MNTDIYTDTAADEIPNQRKPTPKDELLLPAAQKQKVLIFNTVNNILCMKPKTRYCFKENVLVLKNLSCAELSRLISQLNSNETATSDY